MSKYNKLIISELFKLANTTSNLAIQVKAFELLWLVYHNARKENE